MVHNNYVVMDRLCKYRAFLPGEMPFETILLLKCVKLFICTSVGTGLGEILLM